MQMSVCMMTRKIEIAKNVCLDYRIRMKLKTKNGLIAIIYDPRTFRRWKMKMIIELWSNWYQGNQWFGCVHLFHNCLRALVFYAHFG